MAWTNRWKSAVSMMKPPDRPFGILDSPTIAVHYSVATLLEVLFLEHRPIDRELSGVESTPDNDFGVFEDLRLHAKLPVILQLATKQLVSCPHLPQLLVRPRPRLRDGRLEGIVGVAHCLLLSCKNVGARIMQHQHREVVVLRRAGGKLLDCLKKTLHQCGRCQVAIAFDTRQKPFLTEFLPVSIECFR